jgi:predicted Zn-dependent protease with MMP-like domain
MGRSPTPEQFEQLVADALDALPAWLQPALDDVAIRIEDEPPAELGRAYAEYVGVPLGGSPIGALPPLVRIFRGPLVADFGRDSAELRRQVSITLAHEIGHHLGFDEQQLDELGYA